MSAPCPVLGFVVMLAVGSEADRAPIAADLVETLERSGLTAEPRSNGRTSGSLQYLVQRDGAQATDEDRALVRGWAARWVGRAETSIGDLIDLNQAA